MLVNLLREIWLDMMVLVKVPNSVITSAVKRR